MKCSVSHFKGYTQTLSDECGGSKNIEALSRKPTLEAVGKC